MFLPLATSILVAAPSSSIAGTTNLIAVADTGLFENNPNNNLGGMNFMPVGTTGPAASGSRSRGLLKFDVANHVPAGATISSATLSLTVVGFNGFGRDFKLHRVFRPWTEGSGTGIAPGVGLGSAANPGDSTWNSRSHSDSTWSVPGGQDGTDYASTVSATATMGFEPMVFTSETLASDVQMWLDDSGTNSGWLIMIGDESPFSTASMIATRESSGSEPVLTIEFTFAAAPNPPEFFDIALVENAIRFSFNAQSSHSYAVEFTDSFNPTNWTVLTNIAASPEDTTISVTNVVDSGERYFRASAQ